MKKIISIFMVISLLCMTYVKVCATSVKQIENISTSNSAVLSRKSTDVAQGLLNVLSENGADINNETLIEVLNVNNSDDTAICVTNVENGTLERDIFISYIEENENLVIDNSMAEILAQGPDYNMSADFPPLSWDGNYMVHATATAALYSDGFYTYYKPYKCSFYYENYTGVTVNSIYASYIADGFLYSYPGFESLGLDEYEHVVTVYKANPVAGVTYSNTNYFATDKVLMTIAGSPFVGHYLTFINVVNGEELSYTVTL